jgi:hypothetical protein
MTKKNYVISVITLSIIFLGCIKTMHAFENKVVRLDDSARIVKSAQGNTVKDPCDFSSYHPIRISEAIANHKNDELFMPEYPEEAKKKKVEGDVIVKILKNRDGLVVKACAIAGNPLLRKAAEAAALKCHFEPILLNNERFPRTNDRFQYIEDTITYKFVLSKVSISQSKAIGTKIAPSSIWK